ncbi:hypothetical protein [Thermoanaerobacterium thermosaccharolyticum]|uniref:hypothetical protein n=1 Tax=Thermoanaerobacterium thermosaccharolyticum TaxID=1517 RepID=UPI003DA91DFD
MYVDEEILKEITKRVIEEINKKQKTDDVPSYFIESGIAYKGKNIKEVVIGIGPCLWYSFYYFITVVYFISAFLMQKHFFRL